MMANNSNATFYLAVYDTGAYISKETFDELAVLPGNPYLFQYSGTFNEPNNLWPIDNTSAKTKCVIGDYEFVDVKKGSALGSRFRFKFYHDVSREVVEISDIGTNAFQFSLGLVIKEVKEASKFSSLEEYRSFKNLKALQSEHSSLKAELENLKARVEKLEEVNLKRQTV